jgi:hypothetical protein
VISLGKLSVVYSFNVSNLYKIVCKTDLLKMVLVVKGGQSGYAMEFLKFSIASFGNRKNSDKCLENPASRLAIKDRQDDI